MPIESLTLTNIEPEQGFKARCVVDFSLKTAAIKTPGYDLLVCRLCQWFPASGPFTASLDWQGGFRLLFRYFDILFAVAEKLSSSGFVWHGYSLALHS